MLPSWLTMKVALITGAALLAALVALSLWSWRIDTLRARHLQEAQASELRHTITKTSLNTCNGHIADNNRRIQDAADKLEQAKREAAANDARANTRYKPTGKAVSALERSSGRKDLPACQVTSEALRSLEGL